MLRSALSIFVTVSLTLAAPLGALGTRSLSSRPAGSTNTSGRDALVIGNDAYSPKALRNAVNDARAMAAALQELGFHTTLVLDVTQVAFERALEGFLSKLSPGGTALFFYAGHGMQVDGENLLVPVDFTATDDVEARRQAYAVEDLQAKVARKGVSLQILILDACRDDPFRGYRSSQRGLAAVRSAVGGTIIAFATQPGGVADDNPQGQNGIFTNALLNAMFDPTLEIEQLFSRVREAVNATTNGRQTPWMTTGRVAPFSFVERDGAAATHASDPDRAELAFWDAVNRADADSPALLTAYLKAYPNGMFTSPAKIKLHLLTDASKRAGTQRPAVRYSVAIAPLKNLSGRPELNYIGSAIGVTLGFDLAATERVRVLKSEGTLAAVELTAETVAKTMPSAAGTRGMTNRPDFVITGSYLASPSPDDKGIRVDLRLDRAPNHPGAAFVTETGATLVDIVAHISEKVKQLLGLHNPTVPTITAASQSLPTSERSARLYGDALENMRKFEHLAAKDQLLELTGLEPGFAPGFAALAECWHSLGFDASARESADRARQLATSLPREQGRQVEGLYFFLASDWPKAIALYEALTALDDENLDYFLTLVDVQLEAGRPKAALDTLNTIRARFRDEGNDPRVGVREAEASLDVSDYRKAQVTAAKAAAEASAEGMPLIAALANLKEAWAWYRLDYLDKARDANNAALDAYTTAGDRGGAAAALTQLATGLTAQGKIDEALNALNRAITLTRAIGNQRRLSAAFINLAELYYNEGRLPDAERTYKETLPIVTAVDDKAGIGKVLLGLGTVLYDQGRGDEGIVYDREALRLYREVGDRRGVALQLTNMAESSLDRGELQLAKGMYEEAVQINESLDRDKDAAYALQGLATVEYWQGRLTDAATGFSRALALRTKLRDIPGMVESQLSIARVASASANCGEAIKRAETAIKQTPAGERSLELSGRATLLEAFTCSGQLSTARDWLAPAPDEGIIDARARFPLFVARARLSSALKRDLDAESWIVQARSISDSLHSRWLTLLTDVADLHVSRRRADFPQRAKEVAQRAAEAGAGLLVSDVGQIQTNAEP